MRKSWAIGKVVLCSGLILGMGKLAAGATVIYNNTFSTSDSSAVGSGATSNSGLTPLTSGTTIQSNGSTATLINTATSSGGYFITSAGSGAQTAVSGLPNVTDHYKFSISADFSGVSTASNFTMGFGLFGKGNWAATTDGSGGSTRFQFAPNNPAGGGFFQAINFRDTSRGTATSDAPAPTFPNNIQPTWSSTDVYRLQADFTFVGTAGVAGSTGTNNWDVTLTLTDVTLSDTVLGTATFSNWLTNTLYMNNLASSPIALFARGTSASGITVDNFVVTTPEPASLSLLGIAGLALLRRTRRPERA